MFVARAKQVSSRPRVARREPVAPASPGRCGRHTRPLCTARALPTATRESKMTMLTSGRALTFRECLRSGDETQMNRR